MNRDKIIYPETPDYSITSLIIIAVAVVVKVVLGKYVKAQGKKLIQVRWSLPVMMLFQMQSYPLWFWYRPLFLC